MAGIGVNQKIMLHLDGVDESISFPDSSFTGHSTSAIGTAQIDTAIADPWGGNDGILLLDGNSDGVSVIDSSEFDLSNYDWAIDFRVRFNSLSGNQCFAGRPTSAVSYFYFALEGGNVRLRDYVSGNVVDLSFGSPSLSTNTWYHFAITRNGNNFRFFINGTQFGSTQTSSASFTNRSDAFQIGCNTATSYYVKGQMSEFRLTVGDYVWNSNFTPEIAPYTTGALERFTVNETVVWNEDYDWPQGTAEYGQQIISINPLIFVSNSSPAKITKINVDVPASITWQSVEITGLDYAKSVGYNSNTGYLYVSGANGKVAKISLTNILSQSIIDTSESDELENLVILEDFNRTFINTDDSDGEIVVLDEATISTINTDLRLLKEYHSILSTRLDVILGKVLSTDLRILSTTPTSLKTDLRILKYAYDEISRYPISDSDIEVYINAVEMTQYNDIDMRSIIVTYNIDTDYSTASFKLNRKHDRLNYTDSDLASEITDNNAVIIKIDDKEVFSGTISNVDAESETELVQIQAIGDKKEPVKNTINIPMATLNDDCHLYQCFMNNPSINMPVLNTQSIIGSSSGKFWSGTDWVGDREKAIVFNSFTLAENYILANAKIRGYTSQEVYPVNKDANPEHYNGVFVNLGILEKQNIIRLASFSNITWTAEELSDGTFRFNSGWDYFWFCIARNFITASEWATLRYIGTDLNIVTTDTYKISGASYKIQKQLDNSYTDLGMYYLGSAPYEEISCKNGKFISANKWEDKTDGLYRVKDEEYNYINFAKDIAASAYAKLKNINGTILPITSAEIELSFDGYFYYGVKLLSRMNVTNTATSNQYNGNNGFPVAVKIITINTSNMKVTLSCDNQFSSVELEEMDDNTPKEDDEKYITEAESVLNYRKYNINTGLPIIDYQSDSTSIERYGT